MKDCIIHSILVHDACGNFKETLTFNNIFSLECAYADVIDPTHHGYKYVSLEGNVFDTAKHLVLSHRDASGNSLSERDGNKIYHATEMDPVLKGTNACSVCSISSALCHHHDSTETCTARMLAAQYAIVGSGSTAFDPAAAACLLVDSITTWGDSTCLCNPKHHWEGWYGASCCMGGDDSCPIH